MSKPNWTIAWGDNYHFDIMPATPGARDAAHSHEALNGIWSSRARAAEQAIATLETVKRAAAHNISRGRAIVRRESAKAERAS